MQRLAASERHTHASLAKEQDELDRKIARLIGAIETGAGDVAGLVARLRKLEARGKEIAAELATLGKPPIALHRRPPRNIAARSRPSSRRSTMARRKRAPWASPTFAD
jgi:hypothetical protein